MAFVSLFIVLIIVGLMVLGVIALLMAESILHPPKMNDGKALYLYQRLSPADLGLSFTEVIFTLPDNDRPGKTINIAAWWIETPAPSDRCIVLIHGYADARISSSGWAPLLHSSGWNVLAIDLRAHGESGGRRCTAGVLEGGDVAAILNELQLRWPASCRKIALFGISMGATIALACAAESECVAGVIMESPYDDFVETARQSSDVRGLPSGIAFTLAMWIAQRWAKIDYRAVRSSKLLERVNQPVLLLVGASDRIVDQNQRSAIEQSMTARRRSGDRIVHIADADHLLGPGVPQVDSAIADFLQVI